MHGQANGFYTQHFNRRHGLAGHLFRGLELRSVEDAFQVSPNYLLRRLTGVTININYCSRKFYFFNMLNGICNMYVTLAYFPA
jgi:hypothetical protein